MPQDPPPTEDTARLAANGPQAPARPGDQPPLDAAAARDTRVPPPQPLPLSSRGGRHASGPDEPTGARHARRITDRVGDATDRTTDHVIDGATHRAGDPAVARAVDDATDRAADRATDRARDRATDRPAPVAAAADPAPGTAAMPVAAQSPPRATVPRSAPSPEPADRPAEPTVAATTDPSRDPSPAEAPADDPWAPSGAVAGPADDPADAPTQEQPVMGGPVAGHAPRPDGHGAAGHGAAGGDSTPPGDGDGAPGGTGDRPGPRRRRAAVLVPAGAVLALALVYGVDLLVAGSDVPRNTVVAGVPIGGLSPAAAASALEEQLAPRVTAEHVLMADDVEAALSPATAGITLDVPGTVDAAGDQPLNPWTRLTSLFTDHDVEPVITEDETALAAQVDRVAETVDRAPVDATITIEDTTPELVEPVDGRTLDRPGSIAAIEEALASGGDPDIPIRLPVDTTPVRVDADEAARVLADTVTPALSAPVTVTGTGDDTSVEVPVDAIAAALTFTPGDDGTLGVALDPAQLQESLGDELGEFGAPAQDARFEVTGDAIRVVPSVDGTGVDPAALAGTLLPVLREPAPREVTAQLGPVPAAFTTEQAQALGITEKVSSFSTNFTNTASGTNIRVVAEEVDGAVVKPGETFSLNGFTGPRGTAEGYVSAGVINNGEFTQAVGGGISQFATTMFNAVFFAGLEDVFHKPHSYYISRYPAGREATVYYDSIDLKWRNDSPAGIYVQATWVPGTITVTFWGTKRFDIESSTSERFNLRQPVVQEKPDDGSCASQGGSTGFDVVVTRTFNDPATGAEIRRQDFRTRYAAEPVIRCVPVPAPAPDPAGTVPPAPGGPAGRRPPRPARR